MEAILAGMVEGVIVVDPRGRVQLANRAARQMLRLDDLAIGRHYVETIRHPAITDLVGAALAGRTPDFVQLSPPRDQSRTIMARAAPATPGGPRRRSRAARHHRPADAPINPPRFRRQRLTRAAHAADRDPRLRRGAVGRRRER